MSLNGRCLGKSLIGHKLKMVVVDSGGSGSFFPVLCVFVCVRSWKIANATYDIFISADRVALLNCSAGFFVCSNSTEMEPSSGQLVYFCENFG